MCVFGASAAEHPLELLWPREPRPRASVIEWRDRIAPARPRFTPEEAQRVAHLLGIDFAMEDFDLDRFRRAMNVELEHGCCHPETDVTHDDPLVTGKLALAHLRERPDFYEYLLEVEGVLER